MPYGKLRIAKPINMSSPLVYFLVLVSVHVISIWFYMAYARKNNILDIPNERSSHSKPIFRGAGIAILPGLMLAWFTYLLPLLGIEFEPSQYARHDHLDEIFVGAGLMLGGVIGFLDDRYTLSNKLRLPLYSVATLLVTQFGTFTEIHPALGVLVLVVLVGSVNTYNFMDGINGITVLYTFVLLFYGFILFWFAALEPNAYPLYLLGIAAYLVVFAFLNLRKNARAFLGDSGSVLFGLVAVFIVYESGVKLGTWTSITLLLVYGVDSVGTILIRLLRRENIFQAHRSHLYQDLVHKNGWSHMKTSFVYALCQWIISGFWLFSVGQGMDHIFFIVSLSVLILIYVWAKVKNGSLKEIQSHG
jgi:UDP-GlcNAc:undecaprenyl-phosphate GlcNAc-1-phosphate transferase